MSSNSTTPVADTTNAPSDRPPCITLHHSRIFTSPAPEPGTPSPEPEPQYPIPDPQKREFPLSRQQRRAISLLVLGHPDTHVAKAVGVNRSTLYRWRIYHTTFQTELNRQRNSLWTNNADRLRALAAKALATLEKHMDSANERAAFRSAVSILRFAKAAAPTGPLDEYDLLEEHYRRYAEQETVAQKLSVAWPPDKRALDELREFFLRRAHNQPVAPTTPPPDKIGYAGLGVVTIAEARP